MLKTENFGFNIVEGSDIVDLEGFYNPNFQLLDTTLKSIEQTGVMFTDAITKTGTVYTLEKEGLTPLFMFLAPSTYIAGDTFVINGTTFGEVYGADGSYLPERGFVTGAVVLAAIQNNRLTCYAAISGSSTPGPDPEGYMQTDDYVGADATGVVHRAESAATADSATTATTATNATHADTADSATNATHADTATTATNATHADTADSATNATHADTATLAETATLAQDATKLGRVAASSYTKNSDIIGSSATKTVFKAYNLTNTWNGGGTSKIISENEIVRNTRTGGTVNPPSRNCAMIYVCTETEYNNIQTPTKHNDNILFFILE